MDPLTKGLLLLSTPRIPNHQFAMNLRTDKVPRKSTECHLNNVEKKTTNPDNDSMTFPLKSR